MLPVTLLARATAASGTGITPTIREGLAAVAAAHAGDGLLPSRQSETLELL